MRPSILGRKIGMTRILDEAGVVHPVTVVAAGPCIVMQVKDLEKDGYHAIQVGFEDVRPFRATRPMIGKSAGVGAAPKRFLREFRSEDPAAFSAGDVLTVSVFKDREVRYVDVAGVSKGRGFAGVMKRHGFGGQPASHGTERKHRSPGAIGSMGSRGRGRCIKKGKRMAGHMGHANVTMRNQRLLAVDEEKGLLLIRGGLPGPNGGLVVVRQSKTRG